MTDDGMGSLSELAIIMSISAAASGIAGAAATTLGGGSAIAGAYIAVLGWVTVVSLIISLFAVLVAVVFITEETP